MRATPGALGLTAVGVTVGLLLAGCASRQGAIARSSPPPKLHLAHADVAAAGVGAPMAATSGGPASGRLSLFGEFVLVGTLPDKPTHAPVWRWAAAAATQDEVVRVGHAVGVTGTPQRHAHGWLLSSAAGDVRVADTAGHEWSYTRADLRSCSPYMMDIDSEPNGSVSGCATATSSGEQIPNGPDDATSRAAAAPVISGLGIEGAEQVNVGAPSSYVSISPLVGGLPTQGLETSIDVDATGVRSAHGRLAAPAAGDDYPLRTAKQGFADLANRPRPMLAMPYCGPIGIEAPAPPMPAATAGGSAVVPAPPIPSCPTPTPQRVTGASIGLQLTYEGIGLGSALLVPAWFFTVEGSPSPVTAIAIDPAFLDSGDPGGGSLPAGVIPPEPSAVSGGSGSASSGGGAETSGAGGAQAPPTNLPPVVEPNR